MMTFNEFIERKQTEGMVTECAHLMAELDVNPYEYIYECLKETDPVLAEGWWDGVQAAAKNIWQGVRRFAGDTAKGVAAGAKGAADAVAGPVAKFDTAVRALDDLLKVLGSDPRFKNFMSSQGKGTVERYVGLVRNALLKDKEMVPQLMQTQVQQNYGTRADAEAQKSNASGNAAQAAAPVPAPAATGT